MSFQRVIGLWILQGQVTDTDWSVKFSYSNKSWVLLKSSPQQKRLGAWKKILILLLSPFNLFLLADVISCVLPVSFCLSCSHWVPEPGQSFVTSEPSCMNLFHCLKLQQWAASPQRDFVFCSLSLQSNLKWPEDPQGWKCSEGRKVWFQLIFSLGRVKMFHKNSLISTGFRL